MKSLHERKIILAFVCAFYRLVKTSLPTVGKIDIIRFHFYLAKAREKSTTMKENLFINSSPKIMLSPCFSFYLSWTWPPSDMLLHIIFIQSLRENRFRPWTELNTLNEKSTTPEYWLTFSYSHLLASHSSGGWKKNRINVPTPTYFHLGIQIIVVDVVFHLIPSLLCVRSILSTYIFLSLCKGNIKIQISFYDVCFGVGYEFSVLFSRLWKLINNWSNGLVLQAFSSCVT